MAKNTQNSKRVPLIGMLAVKNRLITREELEAGLAASKDALDVETALKAYFLSRELISKQNINRLVLAAKAVSIRQKEFRFGAIAVAKGFINKSVLDLALEDQQEDLKKGKKPRLIGNMMVEAGLLTEKQRDYILKLQNRRTAPGKAGAPKAPVKTGAPGAPVKSPVSQAPEKAGSPQSGGETEDADAAKEEPKDAPPEMLPPEIIAGEIKLQVSGDFMDAFLTKTEAFDEDVQVEEIKDELFDRGIVSGVMADEMIEGFINSTGFKTQAFRVAKGIRAIHGQDAKIEFFFNTDYLKAGGMDENGNIDFKQRGEIPLVEKGTVLAEKTPRVEPRWGQNIYGNEVAADPGEDRALQFGKGAVLSEDGQKVLAGVRGYPKYSLSGVIYVHEEYTTGGDVDFETGHIEFDGNVNVKGCIKAGFKVSGNDISSVEVDGGVVEAQGDLKVAGGINEGKIYARGNVYAKYILNSEIVCMGDVYVQKEIVDSTIESSGACSIVAGKLISSKVSAKMGLSARNIGTQMASPSLIKVGHDAFTEKELAQNKARVTGIKEEIQALEEKKTELAERNAALQKEITELAHIQDRSQLETSELEGELADPDADRETLKERISELKDAAEAAEENLDACFEKIESLELLAKKIDKDMAALNQVRESLIQERNNLVRWSKENPGKAQVVVEGEIQSGTVVKGKHSEYTVEKTARHLRITEILFKGDDGDDQRTVYQMKVGNY